MTAPLWTAEAAAAAVEGRATGDWAASGVEIDSRRIQPGDLFVALTGAARDGHAFVAAALDAGAAAALVSRRPEDAPADAPLLQVEGDTLAALARLGAAARARAARLGAIAVTGSVGKTSTKEMLAHMLREQRSAEGPTHAAASSFNNHIGVPLTLARMPADARYGVFEIGMNAPGEIAPLARLARPHAAIVTAIAAVHLEAFENLAGIAREKASIFEGLAPGGVAVLPSDDPHFPAMAAQARAAGAAEIFEFGADAPHARLIGATLAGDDTIVQAELFGQEILFKIGAPGRHFARNALAALAAVRALGADLSHAALSLGEWRAVSGRGARAEIRLEGGGAVLLVDESYNANPASVAAAVETFAAAPTGRAPSGAEGDRHVFLTDMLELGPDGPRLHAALAGARGMDAIDAVHTAGPLMRALHDALPESRRGVHAPDAEALAEAAARVVQAGDAVMVKGSLGSRARVVAERLRSLDRGRGAEGEGSERDGAERDPADEAAPGGSGSNGGAS